MSYTPLPSSSPGRYETPSPLPELFASFERGDANSIDDDGSEHEPTQTPTQRTAIVQRTRGELMYAEGSDPGVLYSSPVLKRVDTVRKLQRKGADTRAKKKEEQDTQERDDKAAKIAAMEEALEEMYKNKITLVDLIMYASNKENKTREWRRKQLFSKMGNIATILDSWNSSANSKTVRKAMRSWALATVICVVQVEADKTSKAALLRVSSSDINRDFVTDFKFEQLRANVEMSCPTLVKILLQAVQTKRQSSRSRNVSDLKDRKKSFAIMSAITLLGERSKKNNYLKHLMGLFLYSTSALRQLISVLNHLGLSMSYTTLAGRGRKNRERTLEAAGLGPAVSKPAAEHKRLYPPGTLELLSRAMRALARELVAKGLFLIVYDNINMMWRVVEQRIGNSDSQENGTCTTIMMLFKANPSDLKTKDLLEAFDRAPPLKLADIELGPGEFCELKRRLLHTVLRIIIQFGGKGFAKFKRQLTETAPVTEFKIELHLTDIFPLPAMNINESSTAGNAAVIEAILKELGLDPSAAGFAELLRLVAGDQLSIARIRSVIASRAGNETIANALLWIVMLPGLFHYMMAATLATLETHLGQPNRDQSDPASLMAHNEKLQRRPIVPSSLPNFRTCRDLIFVSLYARVLHCLLRVSGKTNIDEYSLNTTWEELYRHAETIVEEYANANNVEQLRSSREFGESPVDEGDKVYENAVLFMRDALLLREFADAKKVGDSGRVMTILKVWALSFRGSGRSKYAFEAMQLIHNMTHVYSPALIQIIFNNWLVNPTGKANSWVELDLVQEHLNFWIKDNYQAHGSAASWSWLQTISPCVEPLRKLATEMHSVLGSKQGNIHAAPDLSKDINKLMRSLADNNVYVHTPNRKNQKNVVPVQDVISSGHNILAWGAKSPLVEFNKSLKVLQQHRRVPPLGDNPPNPSADMPDSVEQGAGGDLDNESEAEEIGSDKGDEIDADGMDKDGREDDTNNATTIDLPDCFLQSSTDVEFDMDGFDEDDEAGSDGGWSTDDSGLSEGEGDVDDILDDSGDEDNDGDELNLET